jgi:hypothetical protein
MNKNHVVKNAQKKEKDKDRAVSGTTLSKIDAAVGQYADFLEGDPLDDEDEDEFRFESPIEVG